MTAPTSAQIAAALGRATREGKGWRCLCPAHNDHTPSLSIIENDGKILLTCRAGCTQAAVIEALKGRGLWSDKPNGADRPADPRRIVAQYDYRDETGKVLFQVCRTTAKDFPQRRPNGNGGWTWGLGNVRRVLYRLPELMVTPMDQIVYVVEGEKDVATLERWGLIATCNPGGAGNWRSEFAQFFAGRDVVVIPDHDEQGRRHATAVAASLAVAARRIRVVELPGLPPSGDISDFVAAGASQSDFETLVEQVPPYDGAGKANGHGRGLRLGNAAELVARHFSEPKWAVPNIIAEGLTILAGRPKTGKSWWALDAAVAVAGGYQACGNIACEKGNVLLLALEDNDRRLHQRLKAVLQGPRHEASRCRDQKERRKPVAGKRAARTSYRGLVGSAARLCSKLSSPAPRSVCCRSTICSVYCPTLQPMSVDVIIWR